MNQARKLGVFYKKEAPLQLKVGQRDTLEMKFRPASIDEIKALGDNLPDGYVAGWASTNSLDHYGDRILNGAFLESIEEKGLTGPRGIKFLIQHRADKPAGKITKLEQRDQGLWMEAQLNLDISYVKDAYEASKMQGGLNFSVGYRLVKGGFRFVDMSEKGEDSYWEISKADLHEVSVVTFPGNDDAEMTFIKGAPDEEPFETVAEAEKALVASGFAKSRREANRFVRWIKGLTLDEDPVPEPPVTATPQLNDTFAKAAELTEKLSKLKMCQKSD